MGADLTGGTQLWLRRWPCADGIPGSARKGFQGVRGRDSRECAGRLLTGASILLVLVALQIAATPAAAAASPGPAGAAPTATEGATAATRSAGASFPDLWSELLAAVGEWLSRQPHDAARYKSGFAKEEAEREQANGIVLRLVENRIAAKG